MTEETFYCGLCGVRMNPQEFTLVPDDNGHWYVIPANKEHEMDTWLDEGWLYQDAPSWATRLSGSPSRVRFTGWGEV